MRKHDFCTMVKELLGMSVSVSLEVCKNINQEVESSQDVTKSVSLDVCENIDKSLVDVNPNPSATTTGGESVLTLQYMWLGKGG